ncbi:hypothetical protein IAR55_004751 [Kwoniella newhampshirensis]|uniref:Uncharacterized protein n=1 Tax=Kwoniella newhampshirensis TaxID=1651941 RepID=A0AAW0YIC6_9TREE
MSPTEFSSTTADSANNQVSTNGSAASGSGADSNIDWSKPANTESYKEAKKLQMQYQEADLRYNEAVKEHCALTPPSFMRAISRSCEDTPNQVQPSTDAASTSHN